MVCSQWLRTSQLAVDHAVSGRAKSAGRSSYGPPAERPLTLRIDALCCGKWGTPPENLGRFPRGVVVAAQLQRCM